MPNISAQDKLKFIDKVSGFSEEIVQITNETKSLINNQTGTEMKDFERIRLINENKERIEVLAQKQVEEYTGISYKATQKNLNELFTIITLR